MKKFLYDLMDPETQEIVKKDVAVELTDDATVASVEFFCGGIEYQAVNVREMKGELS